MGRKTKTKTNTNMKVTKINAFKANDGSLWEKESEAINDNINGVINQTFDHSCENSTGDIINDVKKWVKNHPKEVRYLLANIKHAEIDE